MLGSTLLTIHNEHFIVNLVAQMRQQIIDGTYWEFKQDFMARYYGATAE
jgi:tRNA-guanine family transglycosylase